MRTDFSPEAPHTDYECTLHVRGTKAWFQTILDLLDTAAPSDVDQANAKIFLKSEVEEIINWIHQNESSYKTITK